MTRIFALVAVSALALSACNDKAGNAVGSRDYITAVGSSTVYPFATATAEAFAAANAGMKTPKIESTGTGGGIERFCRGIGAAFPDIANASRRMKKSEFETCVKNGVKDIVEIPVGIDGIVFAEATNGPKFALSEADIFKALAAKIGDSPNSAKRWKDVNPALPAVEISVFGPPSTSGTYDAFKELILAKGCDADPALKAIKDSNAIKYDVNCHTLRSAPQYVEQGEQDNLIVQKLTQNPNSIGIFGYSYLMANRDRLRAVPLQGVEPNDQTIADGKYPGARPLYIYVKKAHIGVIPGLKEYIAAFIKGGSKDGALTRKGLIALPDAQAAKVNEIATQLPSLEASTL